jgi:hypothetical protein
MPTNPYQPASLSELGLTKEAITPESASASPISQAIDSFRMGQRALTRSLASNAIQLNQ